VLALVMGLGTVYADSISPDTFSASLAVGGSVTIEKTVTITKQATAPIDIFFLMDTTGSMSGAIGAVKTGFNSIVTNLAGVASNVAFGGGQYKDTLDPFRYSETIDLTTNTVSVQTAINGWFASGGGDGPEANLFGLQAAANQTSWRAGSQRILVWVGDYPGHDPDGGATEASAIAALQAAGVKVFAASANSGPGLDAACTGVSPAEGGPCAAGQATRITAATGGSYLGTFNSGTMASAITSALVTSIDTYSKVELMPMGLPAGVGVATSPLSYTGSFDRSVDRTFTFDVTFTGLAPGSYDFSIDAVLDGTEHVATETDHIDVHATGVPEAPSFILMSFGIFAMGFAARKYAINRA
jgi:hypothetical protein